MPTRDLRPTRRTGTVLFTLLFLAVAAFTSLIASAQDSPDRPDPSGPDSAGSGGALFRAGAGLQTTRAASSEGYTIWRLEVDSTCLFADHNYSLSIPVEPGDLSDISYRMSNWDVDYATTACDGQPEVDIMHWNNSSLGVLTGANDSWSINSWPIQPSQMISGTNDIYIDTDSTATGCWCVGVGYVELRAKVGFRIVEQTPQPDDRNRDFHADRLDLTITFSDDYDPETLDDNSFKLEYRDQTGSWVQVTGSHTQLGPRKFRFDPAGDLKDGIRYRVTVKNGEDGVKSVDGGELEDQERWYFWTVPNMDLTDAFDYGAGSVCPPMPVPCDGFEISVFQVARNAGMVDGKDAVARLFARWKQHDDVLASDQVTEIEAQVEITIGGTTHTMRQLVRRPDRYSAGEKKAAANSINIRHTPTSPYNYTAKLTPLPQTNDTIVEYNQARNLDNAGQAPYLQFNYFLLRDGDWAAGVPAAARAEGSSLMAGGSLAVTDQFPVDSTAYFERGEHSIGYTLRATTTNDPVCGPIRDVNCPTVGGAGTYVTNELECVFDHYTTMLGGNPFVAVTTPGNLCPIAAAQAIGGSVFMHQYARGANDAAIAHEVGHLFDISTLNIPTPGHRNSSDGVEGYQVRVMTNRSHVENPSMSTSLMHTTVQPDNTSWVHNDDYATLLRNMVPPAAQAPLVGDYLIVFGRIDLNAGTVFLEPAYRQELPNDPPSDSGECTISLRDASDNVLSADKTTPGVSLHALGPAWEIIAEVEDAALAGGPQFFSVSLPWHDNAHHLRITCGGQTLLTYQRSANPPAVSFNNLSNGDVLSGNRSISWSGSDSDGNTLVYQLQYSINGGVTFMPLTFLGTENSFLVDSTALPSGDLQIRVIASDGFNTSFTARNVTADNPLRLLGVTPAAGSGAAGANSTATAAFVSEVNPATLLAGGFTMRNASNQSLAGKVSYNEISRVATFTPLFELAHDTTYTAFLAATVADVHGNTLGSQVTWSFTTGPDDSPPVVWKVSPVPGAPEEPRNALVQVRFREPMNAGSLTGGALQLLDQNGAPVAGTITYNALRWLALFTPQTDLAANHTYTARLTTAAMDLAGNALESPYEWKFTTGSNLGGPLRIIGNYNDVPLDLDGDGLYNSLNLVVDVEVQVAGDYNLNGRLMGGNERLIGWATSYDYYLTPGVHMMVLPYPSALLRSNGEDGPYLLDSLNFYDVDNPNIADTASRAYRTFPYEASDFYALLAFGGVPDIFVEAGTTLEDALNLRDFTYHASRPLSDVSYGIYVNTDPAIGMSIDGGDNLDFAPAPGALAESDVTIEATDPDGNRALASFHVGVQAPRVYRLTSNAPASLTTGAGANIEFQLRDQWDRLFQQSTEVSFSTGGGNVTPATMTTSNGRAAVSYTAGNVPGLAFITVTAGDVEAAFFIEIVGQNKVFMPVIVK